MDQHYLRFIDTNPLYYDVPDERLRRGEQHYDVPSRHDWSDWRRTRSPHWLSLHPGHELPAQGWKIHVSATRANAQRVLDIVADYSHEHKLSFKFVPTERALLARNDKQADRGSSGKFITLYPRDDRELEATLVDLDALLGEESGPYILSDLRWREGPLYVRFGGIHPMTVLDDNGVEVPAVVNPDGQHEPDVRGPSFAPPTWAIIPPFLRTQLDALGATETEEQFPYEIEAALHFSNGGGVYRARRDGVPVVLKEARPHAGLTPDGRDAVQRLVDEETHLRRLQGDEAVIGVRDSFEFGGHRFLALDEAEGRPLHKSVVERCPAARVDAGVAAYLDYRSWALGIADQLERLMQHIHDAGIVYGDLHPGNIIVADDGHITLIDFEMAHDADAAAPLMGAPGFAPPPGLTGTRADRYSLACVMLFLFLPLTTLLQLDPRKADDLLRAIERMYALPPAFIARLRDDLAVDAPDARPLSRLARRMHETLREWDVSSEEGVGGLQVLIARSIDASADLSRKDRSHAGDIRQFSENGYGLAFGTAGIVHALDSASLDVHRDVVQWLSDAVREPEADRHIGLYDGLAGAGWVLRQRGDDRAADEVLDRVLHRLDEDVERLSSGIHSGLAGLGLYLLDQDAPIATAERIAHELERRMADGSALSQHGLLEGPTGIALFALRLHEVTGDERYMQFAESALDIDLDRCVRADDGSLQLDEGWRLMPYLASGSAGCGLVIAQLVGHTRDPERYLVALDGIQRAAQAPFTIEPGLFHGRAGLMHLLVLLSRHGLATPESERALRAHAEALSLHALRDRAGIGFPGQGLLRLSSDLATGSAGVLTALQAYAMSSFDDSRDSWELTLPLLLPTQPARRSHGASDLDGRR